MMYDYFETVSEALNTVLGGGFIRGEGTLFRYETEQVLHRVSMSLGVGIIDRMFSIVILPHRSLTPARFESYLSQLGVSGDTLLKNDQAFILDTTSQWENHRNVFPIEDLDDIQTATRTALERSSARGVAHLLSINEIESVLGSAGAQSLREWYQNEGLRGRRDFILEESHSLPLSKELLTYYQQQDKQVVSFHCEGDSLRMTVEAAPDGNVGETCTVEPIPEAPFFRINC